jgi:ComF family protein
MNNWLNNNQWLNKSLTINHLLAYLFKQNCTLCAAPTNSELSLCQDCIKDLVPAPHPSCPQCGLSTQGDICGKCIKQRPHYDATHALFTYSYPADAMLQHYKYNNALYLCQTFAQLLIDKIQDNDIDVIIAMPLHPSRIKERGFNQSLEVAKIIAKQCNISLDHTSCSRIKNTPPQASLPLKSRLKNMKNAFQCSQSFIGQHVVLIDDVMTTGSSLNELAKIIKKAGARKISCYVLARAQ